MFFGYQYTQVSLERQETKLVPDKRVEGSYLQMSKEWAQGDGKAGIVEEWNNGMMEEWNVGIMGKYCLRVTSYR